jgi:hypothetical protein
LFLEGKRPGFLALSVLAAMISYLSVATGVLAFVFMIALAALSNASTIRRRVALTAAGSLGALAAVGIQLLVGGNQTPPDILFGLRETLAGLYKLSGSLMGPLDLSRVVSLLILLFMALKWRSLNGRLILLGLLLMILPILFPSTFRADFPGIGVASRYAFLPTIGAALWLGQVVSLTSRVSLPSWCTARQATVVVCGLFVALAAHTASKNIRSKAPHTEQLHLLEEKIGVVVQAYANGRGDGPVPIPSRVITLPVSPDHRPLDYVARYCVPPRLSSRIVGVESNDEFDAFVRQGWPDLADSLVVSAIPRQQR